MIEKIELALNKQINDELFSGYLYLSMAAHFDASNLPGIAHWMREQAKEEEAHAMKIYRHVYDCGGTVKLDAIAKPKTEWKSPLDAFEDALGHEKKITAKINALLELSREEKDYPTESMLKWFIDEQVEEESTADGIVQTLRLIKDSPQGLLMLDSKLGGRGR